MRQAKNTAMLNYFEIRSRIDEAVGSGKNLDIAEKAGVTASAVTNWKTEKKIPMESLFSISEATGVSMHWLLTGEGEKFIAQEPEQNETVRALAFSVGTKAEKLADPTNQAISVELLRMIDQKFTELLDREKQMGK
jgi:transcriptional regulator with XRE-family HTH domain